MSGSSTPTHHPGMMGVNQAGGNNAGPYSKLREPYPAWANDSIPLSKEEIEDVFIDLANKVGEPQPAPQSEQAAVMSRES